MERVESLRTENKFKKTEIGKIPVDWEVAKIGDTCEVVGGSTPSTIVKEFWNGDIHWAIPTDITKLKGNIISTTEKAITKKGLLNCAARILPEGSILLTSRATIGECAINSKPMATNQGFASLICKDRVYNWFVFYRIKYMRKEIQRLGSGSTFNEISKKNIRELKMPIPPLSEQKKIAEILLSVDETIDKKQEIIEKTKMLKKGLMQELLTYGIGHKKFKKTEIGEVPVDWEVAKIGDTCEVVGGSTPSTIVKEFWNGDIHWAIPTDITKLKGNIISTTEKAITKKGLLNCAARILPVGSILLTSRATIGECAINSKPMATNQGFASLICRDEIYNWFVFYRIKYMRKEIQRLGSGSTFNEVSKKNIRKLKIPIPPLSEQKKIAEILTSVDEEIEKEIVQKEKIENIKKGLMQVLLTGKIRVKI